MFGYVTINIKGLDEQQQNRYRSFYCGVCHALGRRHGSFSRCCLTYDMTFLALLLNALYESPAEEKESNCLPHPMEKHKYLDNSHFDYAADMSIALSYYNFLDNWQDNKSVSGLAFSRLLRRRFQAVSSAYPTKCAAIHSCLGEITKCEANGEQNLDVVSGHFGALLGDILAEKQDVWGPQLRELGFYLGKFIYLMDAYEDLAKDTKSGNYNPLKPLAADADFEEKILSFLELQMSGCAAAFERLPILQDADLLRNILYSGVWTRYYSMHAEKGHADKQ